jgi:rhodanese-related sulfurtransferase
VLEINPMTGGRDMNEKFLGVVEARIPQEAKIVVGCKTGGRSASACEILARAGYKNLRNIDGGYSGVTDPTGHVVKEGWSTLGYPIERGEGGENGYEALSQRKP